MEFKLDFKKTVVENLHDFIIFKGFKSGKDFIEVDCGGYIAFCPFKFEVLGEFNLVHIWGDDSKNICSPHRRIFCHCVTCERKYFDEYYNIQFKVYHNLKVFFIDKKLLTRGCTRRKSHREFTCWLKISDNCLCPFHYDTKHSRHLLDSKNHNTKEIKRFAEPIIEKNYDRIVNYFQENYKFNV